MRRFCHIFGALLLSIAMTSAHGQAAEAERLTVYISSEGQLYIIDGDSRREIDETGLSEQLAAVLERTPNALVMVSADSRAPRPTLVRALDSLKQGGAREVTIRTDRGELQP